MRGTWGALVVTAGAVVATARGLDAMAQSQVAPGQVAQGKSEFAARCAGCHGGALEGGSHAPPLVGSGFMAEWAGKKARLVYSRIISTMPQDNPGTLTESQALSITLFVFSVNGIDVGDQPVSRANDLNGLVITRPARTP